MSGDFVKIALIGTAVALTGGAALGAFGAAGAAGAAGASSATGALAGFGASGAMGASSVTAGLMAAAPTATAGLGLGKIALLGGLGLQGLGAIQSGQSQAANAKFNARIAELNAKQQERNATLARRSSAMAAKDIRDETRRRIGSIRSIQAGAGVVTSEGSPLLVQESQFGEGFFEAQKEMFSGEINALGNLDQAANQRLQSQALRGKASSARTAGFIGAGQSLLTGAGSVLR